MLFHAISKFRICIYLYLVSHNIFAGNDRVSVYIQTVFSISRVEWFRRSRIFNSCSVLRNIIMTVRVITIPETFPSDITLTLYWCLNLYLSFVCVHLIWYYCLIKMFELISSKLKIQLNQPTAILHNMKIAIAHSSCFGAVYFKH